MIFFIWCTCGIIHLAIVARLAWAFKLHIPKENPSEPFFSIIIAARNEEQNLQNYLWRILDQAYQKFEVIVALDRCKDNSLSALEKLKDKKLKYVEIDAIPKDWNPKKYALSQAIEIAKGDWLIFTDADCYPLTKEWLLQYQKGISEKKDIILGISPYSGKTGFLNQYIRFEAFLTFFLYISRAIIGKPYMAVGRNMAIRKAFFLEKKGYTYFKSITGGDDDLFIQQNANGSNTGVILGKNSLVISKPETSWSGYWRQKIRHLSVGSKYKSRDQLFLTLFHTTHFGFLVFTFFNHSTLYFVSILLFYLFIKLVSYRFVSKKVGSGFNYMVLPFVDILYAILIPLIAWRSKLEKDIKWKN